MQSLFPPLITNTNFSVESSLLGGDDTFKITIPTLLMKDSLDNLTVQAHLIQENKTVTAEKKIAVDNEAKTATFSLQGIINKDDIFRNRVELPLVIELVHPAQTIAFSAKAYVQDVAVEKNFIDKSVEGSKQMLDDTVGFYKGLFSKKEEQVAESKTPKTDVSQSQKAESRIVFDLQRIATSNACYQIDENTVIRFSQCPLN